MKKNGKYHIDAKIEEAFTLPTSFYTSENAWFDSIDKLFLPAWHYLGDQHELLGQEVSQIPIILLENVLDEAVVLTRKDKTIRCLSNVCTHRGFMVCTKAANKASLQCKYHGRKFDLNGQCTKMPEFEGVKGFPAPSDHLRQFPVKNWHNMLFTSLGTPINFVGIFDRVEERLGFMNFSKMVHMPSLDATYMVNAHWALYCDNYLEGFHIPFVHHDLNAHIDYGQYETQVFDHLVLQIGYTGTKGHSFDLPPDHIDFGKHITAYYFWVFPNFMINVYSWGIQLNCVRPVSPNLTKVDFIYYILDPDDPRFADGDALGQKTQEEDAMIVEGVQSGMRSRFYSRGKFSPRREKGVHYFHQLIAEKMNDQ